MGTLVWTDTFESYAAGPVPAPWTNGGNTNIATAQAHGGTKSLAAGSSGNSSTGYRPLGSTLPQYYADFWMWTNATGAGINQFISFTGDLTNNGNYCPSVNVTAAGAGNCGLAQLTPWFTFSATLGTWHHYLFEVTSSAAGTAKLTVDGVVVGTFSGDTRNTNTAATVGAAYVFIDGATIGPSPPAEFYIDDLSVYSGTTAGGGGTAQAIAMVLA